MLWSLLAFFGFGLLLTFTPCVLPMIPILSSIIIGEGNRISTQRAFALSATYVLAMALTYALAGVAGVLTALVYLQITPFIGIRQGLIGMVAMVIGGVGNLRGALIGGLLIGIIEIMNDAYFTASYRDIILFGLFFIFIVFRPQGLFGAKQQGA